VNANLHNYIAWEILFPQARSTTGYSRLRPGVRDRPADKLKSTARPRWKTGIVAAKYRLGNSKSAGSTQVIICRIGKTQIKSH
jgi:hypothetical protein